MCYLPKNIKLLEKLTAFPYCGEGRLIISDQQPAFASYFSQLDIKKSEYPPIT